jgi:hypothetical protein
LNYPENVRNYIKIDLFSNFFIADKQNNDFLINFNEHEKNEEIVLFTFNKNHEGQEIMKFISNESKILIKNVYAKYLDYEYIEKINFEKSENYTNNENKENLYEIYVKNNFDSNMLINVYFITKIEDSDLDKKIIQYNEVISKDLQINDSIRLKNIDGKNSTNNYITYLGDTKFTYNNKTIFEITNKYFKNYDSNVNDVKNNFKYFGLSQPNEYILSSDSTKIYDLNSESTNIHTIDNILILEKKIYLGNFFIAYFIKNNCNFYKKYLYFIFYFI